MRKFSLIQRCRDSTDSGSFHSNKPARNEWVFAWQGILLICETDWPISR